MKADMEKLLTLQIFPLDEKLMVFWDRTQVVAIFIFYKFCSLLFYGNTDRTEDILELYLYFGISVKIFWKLPNWFVFKIIDRVPKTECSPLNYFPLIAHPPLFVLM